MICNLYSTCVNCTEGCGYFFLLLENKTNICVEDPGIGIPVYRTISGLLGCNASTDGGSTTEAPCTTTMISTTTLGPDTVVTSTVLPMVLGLLAGAGFIISLLIMLYCWFKRRSVSARLGEARSLLSRQVSLQDQARGVRFHRKPTERIEMDAFTSGRVPLASSIEPGQSQGMQSTRTPTSYYNVPASVLHNISFQGISQTTTVRSPNGILKSVETKF